MSTSKEMKQIIKIWFEGDTLKGESDKGEVLSQSLLWYPGLCKASDDERAKYEFGLDGIHWRALDEDVSFESFFYDDAEPSIMQRFFLTHPEINVAGFAKSMGLNATLLRKYINGIKKPSRDREEEIIKHIRSLGQEMANLAMQ